MADQPRDARFKVSADRTSASRKVRYVETNRGDAEDCTLCQLDLHGTLHEENEMLDESGSELAVQAEDAEEEFVGARLLEAIENQLDAQQPPAVQAVLNKLTLVGYPREEIVSMMAQVLAWQINEMLKADQAFDMAAYEGALRALPELPDEA